MRRRLLVLLPLALLAAGCSDDDDGDASSSTTSSSAATSTTLAALEPVSFTDDFELRLPDGIVVHGCEGDRPHVCVDIDGEPAGDIELLAGFPMEPGDTPRSWVDDMVATFRQDRADGCPGFEFEPHPVRDVEVAGAPGAAGGFRLLDADGTVVEDVRNHYVVSGGQMALLGADAYARTGGCLPPSETDPSFTPEQLERLSPHLDRIVAAAVLPEVQPAADCPSRPRTSPATFDDASGTYAATSLEYGDGEVAFDVVQWISDPEAENDYRIENESTQVRTAPVAQGATVLALVDGGGPALEPIEPTDLTTREPSTDEVWWLTFDGGAVVELCQQYRP